MASWHAFRRCWMPEPHASPLNVTRRRARPVAGVQLRSGAASGAWEHLVGRAAEHRLQDVLDPHEVQQRGAGLEIDQKVDVAVRMIVATGRGSEYRHRVGRPGTAAPGSFFGGMREENSLRFPKNDGMWAQGYGPAPEPHASTRNVTPQHAHQGPDSVTRRHIPVVLKVYVSRR